MNTLRYAWHSLARSPVFVTVAILALGSGLPRRVPRRHEALPGALAQTAPG